MGDHSYGGVYSDTSAYPSPIPITTGGLLFKLTMSIGRLFDRLFGCVVPDSDPVESPDLHYTFDSYCGSWAQNANLLP